MTVSIPVWLIVPLVLVPLGTLLIWKADRAPWRFAGILETLAAIGCFVGAVIWVVAYFIGKAHA